MKKASREVLVGKGLSMDHFEAKKKCERIEKYLKFLRDLAEEKDNKEADMSKIKIGMKVRSWDSDIREGVHAHGIIGTIKSLASDEFKDCSRYEIEVESYFSECDGVVAVEEPFTVYPPVNGTRTSLGSVMNCVEPLDEDEEEETIRVCVDCDGEVTEQGELSVCCECGNIEAGDTEMAISEWEALQDEGAERREI